MRKSQNKYQVTVNPKPYSKSEKIESESSYRSLISQSNPYLSHESNLESYIMTESNVSLLDPSHTASSTEDCKIGIYTSAELNSEEKVQIRKRKEEKENKQYKTKQYIRLKLKEEESAIIKKTEEKVLENYSSQELSENCQKIDVNYLVYKCPYHIIDFKCIGTTEEFDHEKDVVYVLAPKYPTKETYTNQVPKKITLTTLQICESQELFIELVRFYQKLGSELNLIPFLKS